MKPPHSLRFALLSIPLFLLPAGLIAETDEQSKVIECSYLYWEDIPEEKLYYRIGEEYHPMEFRRGSRSKLISLKSIAVFEIFREAENPVEDASPYEFLAKASVPGKTKKVLFLVIPPEEEEEGSEYRIVAVDDSLEAFPNATFLFVNLTRQMLSVEFAGETQDIPASQMNAMRSKVGKGGAFVPCIMTGESGERIFGTRLFGQPSGREIVFIRPSLREGTDVPRIKFIPQLTPSPVKLPSPE